MADNTVSIKLTGEDNAGGAFAKATAEMKAFQAVARESGRVEQKASIDSAAAAAVHERALRLVALAEKEVGALSTETAPKVEGLAPAFLKNITPMQGLIAAGAALAPTLFSVGFGLAGLAAAAVGVLEPIKKAATAAGGLQANMHKLDPEQQQAARSLLALGKSYDAFQQSLKPQVLGAWNAGLKIAGHLLADVQPVAKATGNALIQALGSVDKMFASGTWQQFFGFMAQNAGPDVRLLASSFTNLAQTLPPLVEGLKPVNDELLQLLDLTSKGLLGTTQLQQRFSQAAQSSSFWGRALHSLGGAWHQVLGDINPAITKLGPLISQIDKVTQSSGRAAPSVMRLGTVTGDLIHPLGAASAGLASAAKNTAAEDAAARRTATGIGILTSALAKGLGPLQAYIGATITQANDSRALEQALKKSGDKIGYNTANQRASFSAAQTYIADLVSTAQKAIASGQGVDKQTAAIGRALPLLAGVQGKTAAYNAELAALKGYLDQLRAEANIVKYVTIVDNVVHVAPGGQLPGGTAGGMARGGVVGAASGGLHSGLRLVGERGPELVRLPAGSTVMNATQTAQALGSGGGQPVTIEFHAHGSALSQEFFTELAKGIRVRGGSPQIIIRKVKFA